MNSNGIKQKIKKRVGRNGVAAYHVVKQQAKYRMASLRGSEGTIETSLKYRIYEEKDRNLFFGYYDLQQLCKDRSMLLAHSLARGAMPDRDDIDICRIDRESGEIRRIATSKAWNWQQGSRLRWHPCNNDCILYNDYADGGYCTRVFNLQSNTTEVIFPRALYDVSPDFSYGLSLNFSRLQRLRPGYGYSRISDDSTDAVAPEDDGLWKLNLETNECTLLFSLKQLDDMAEKSNIEQSYLNHISISPDGERFIFFHLWTSSAGMSWKNKLYVCDKDGRKLFCLEHEGTVSHYCWKNNTTLLVTWLDGKYFEYDVSTGHRMQVGAGKLIYDGHPSYFQDQRRFLSDTYPLENNLQHLFIFDNETETKTDLMSFYSDPRLYDEYRCDAHPRLSEDGTLVTIDSTYSQKKRAIIEMSLEDNGGTVVQG